jgi:hypothetical protein
MFDIFYIGQNDALEDAFPFATRIDYVHEIQSSTRMFWLVEEETIITDYSVFNFRPMDYDLEYQHIWSGGLSLVPNEFYIGDKHMQDPVCKFKHPFVPRPNLWIVLRSKTSLIELDIANDYVPKPEYPQFSSKEEAIDCDSDWYWIIDSSVAPIEDFNFDYVPAELDQGRIHMWQIENPVTNRVYDYGGVSLCPKVEKTGVRARYMRSVASKSRTYPVYHVPVEAHRGLLSDFYRECAESTKSVGIAMFWVVDTYTQLSPDFEFDTYPTKHDQKYIHAFDNVRLVPVDMFLDNEYSNEEIANNSFDNLKIVNKRASINPTWPECHFNEQTAQEFNAFIKAHEDSPFIWTIDSSVIYNHELTKAGFMPDMLDLDKIHTWQIRNPRSQKVHAYGGLRLWPTNKDYSDMTTEKLRLNRFKDLQYVKEVGSESRPYAVVMISYHDDDADEKFRKIQEKIPNAYHIHDVDGIFEAHKEAAKAVNTPLFWVVDADADVLPNFDFSHIPDVYDQDAVHVWASKNPINGLEYGYGGVKLFPTQIVRDATSWGLDFTTGLTNKFKSMPQVSCVTRFNTSAYDTWRSAFRECVKLTMKDDAESKERLEAWLHPVPDAFFRHDAKAGAEEGRHFAQQNINNIEELNRINDYAWLREKYTERLGQSTSVL